MFANGPEESKSDDVLMAALRFVAVPRGFDALFGSLLVDMAIVRVLRLIKALRWVSIVLVAKNSIETLRASRVV